MDNRRIVIILGVIASIIVVGLIAVYFLIPQNKNNNNNTPTGSTNLPSGFTLEDGEQIKGVSKSFFELYNTYEYDDYSNIYLTGNYSTEKLQYQSISYAETLEETTLENYLRITTIDPNSFVITREDPTAIIVNLTADEESRLTNNPDSVQKRVLKVTLRLVVEEGKWKVDNVQIN